MNENFSTWLNDLTDEERIIIIKETYRKLIKEYTRCPSENMISISGLLLVWYYMYKRRYEDIWYSVFAIYTMYCLGLSFTYRNFRGDCKEIISNYETMFTYDVWNKLLCELDDRLYDEIFYDNELFYFEHDDVAINFNIVICEKEKEDYEKANDFGVIIRHFERRGFMFEDYYNELMDIKCSFQKKCYDSQSLNMSENQTTERTGFSSYNSCSDEELEYFSWSDYYGEEPDSNGDYSNEPVDWD